MQISNFKLIKTKGTNACNKEFTATIDVTTGFLWWKKTKTRTIFREYGSYWYFTDTGEYIPGFKVEKLGRQHRHITGIKL